ncbi:MAG: hypothetical protein HQK51_18195 [Oligoflexia bacterium]|nr:hypothetical protein [Oligoflexia bacterium]
MNNSTKNSTENFFIIVPPSFEELALKEITFKWPLIIDLFSRLNNLPNESEYVENIKTMEKQIQIEKQIEQIYGGLLISLPENMGYLLNPILKIPTRILMRLTSFKCRDFPKLYNKIRKFPWNKYLKGQLPSIEASAEKSRLHHTGRIIETTKEAILNYYQGQPPSKKSLEEVKEINIENFSIYIRFENDICTVSIDTSGEALYKRSYKKFVNEAPLRENLASGLLLKLNEFIDFPEGEGKMLIDPMTGSGTFIIEAALFNTLNFTREYSFTLFPCFKKYISNYQTLQTLQTLHSSADDQLHHLQYQKYLAIDIDDKTITSTSKNFELLKSLNLNSIPIKLIKADVFEMSYVNLEPLKKVIIVNPPYGIRIKLELKFKNKVNFFQKLITTLLDNFKPNIIGIIVPRDISYKQFKLPTNILSLSVFPFIHGGLKLNFIIYKVI